MAVVASDIAIERRPPFSLKGLLAALTSMLVIIALFALWLLSAEADHLTLTVDGVQHGPISMERVNAAVTPFLDTGFFGADMDGIQRAVKALPWVADASVHRHWPGNVSVRVQPENPVARWGKKSLLGADGAVFAPRHPVQLDNLPRLAGPAGTQGQLLSAYQRMQAELKPTEYRLALLRITPRGTWRARLKPNLELRLGRNQVMRRMTRFAGPVVNALGSRLDQAAYVDLRYSNGFAVGWKQKQEDGR